MNRETISYEIPPTGNLLIIESDGKILSRRVSQIYGRALLGAMTLRMNSLPFKILPESSLLNHEPLTLDRIRNAAQANAPRDNFMFVNDNRKILSCRIHPHYGIALLESLQKAPQAVSSLPLSRPQTRESGDSQEAITVSHQHAYEELHQPFEDVSASSLRTLGTPASGMAILPDQIFSSSNRQPYDRDWMDRYNVNEDCLNGYASRYKLDVLLRYGAVKVGDRLCVAYHPDSGPVDKFGEAGSHENPPSYDHDADSVSHRCCKVRKWVIWTCASHLHSQTSMVRTFRSKSSLLCSKFGSCTT